MDKSSKAAQRSTLILYLGRLLAPIYEMVERATPPSTAEYRVAVATFSIDLNRWHEEVRAFTTIDGIWFGQEFDEIIRPYHNLCHGHLAGLARSPADVASKQTALRQILNVVQDETLAAIDNVPIEWESRLLEAKTPFTVHLHIRDAILAAKTRVHYVDRYLNADFFPLYLRELPRSVQVRLLTTRGSADYGVTNVRAVSVLAAAEFSDYQLLESSPNQLHDRNLRVDDRNFHLGPSITAAGTHPTNFSVGDSTPAGHAVLDALLATGVVVT